MEFSLPIGDRTIRFDCPNDTVLGRAKWLLQKEPGTIAWLDRMAPDEVLWDIGANIGVYALYAAIIRGCRVLAFEPAAANYFGLNSNIVLNGIDGQVQAYCLALDRAAKLDAMQMRDHLVGTALHTFGEARDYKGECFTPAWRQGAIALSIDMLVDAFGATFPNHVKIDVDGLETAVVQGGARTFADPRLRSVLVEVDLNDQREVGQIAQVLEAGGLVRDDDVPGNHVRAVEGTRIFNLVYRRAGSAATGPRPA
ncbi:MAG TPA: FkbM family methyltransferase [Geminicoccus sp.]|uniref:FkbM family methyltransferase n=1 Tax=Geminicoccus sp. TaxID=2024832 RepID=UPI002CB2CBE3|nr:FkbM family methyltransferase [Geminicoccus sp.]HWL71839.1 FkbM family methyltransferase [Geminicoccus sp.]